MRHRMIQIIVMFLCSCSIGWGVDFVRTVPIVNTVPTLSPERTPTAIPVSPIAADVADLTIEKIEVSPAITADETIGGHQEIKIYLANIGTKEVRGAVLGVACRETGCPVSLSDTVPITMINPGQKLTVTWPVKPTQEKWKAGSFTLNANFRPKDSSVQEKSLTNNTKMFTVTVKPKLSMMMPVPSGISAQSTMVGAAESGPDYVAVSASLSQPVFAGNTVSSGGKVQLNILNKGTLNAPVSRIRVTCQRMGSSASIAAPSACPAYLSGFGLIPPLNTGASTVFNWPNVPNAVWESGSYALTFEVNDDHKTPELKNYYENNRRDFVLTVGEGTTRPPSLSAVAKPKIELDQRLTLAPIPIWHELMPGHWHPGKKYTVTVVGENISKEAVFEFEQGIAIDKATVIDSHNVQLQISVSGRASPGKTRLKYKASAREAAFAMTSLYGWIQNPVRFLQVPKFQAPVPDLVNFVKGKIKLMTPNFGPFGGAGGNNPDMGIPRANDRTVFEWREENPGVAETFELLIVNKKGDILFSRDTGTDRSYRADPDFVYQLIDIVRSGKIIGSLSVKKAFTAKGSLSALAKPSMSSQKPGTGIQGLSGGSQQNVSLKGISVQGTGSGIGTMKKVSANTVGIATDAFLSPQDKYKKDHSEDIDLYWTVIGKRKYVQNVPQSGGSSINETQNTGKPKQESVEVVVEESEQWPLKIDNFTTGMACSSDRTSGTVQMENLDFGKGKAPGETQTLDYVGDQMRLSGTLSLEKTPWAFNQSQQNGSVIIPNLFVSWGDGTVETARFKKMGTYYTDTSSLEIEEMTHVYTTTGKYIVRLFMLPEGDIQNTDPGSIVQAYDSYSKSKTAAINNLIGNITTGNNSAYMQTLAYSKELPTFDPALVDSAGRAYVLFCKNQSIDPRKDLVSGGTLHLDSIEIVDSTSGSGTIIPATSMSKNKSPSMQVKSTAKPALKMTAKPTLAIRKTQPVSSLLQAFNGSENEELSLSKCDLLQATGSLRYYGKGKAKFSWVLYGSDDSKMVISSTPYRDVGPSDPRDNVTLQNCSVPSDESYSSYPVDMPPQEMEKFAIRMHYKLGVNAKVDYSTGKALTQEETLEALKEAADKMSSNAPKLAALDLTPQMLKVALGGSGTVDPYMAQMASSGVSLGILSPSRHASVGLPTVASVSRAITKSTGISAASLPEVPHQKPYYVSSKSLRFGVHENSPDKVCKLKIATQTGDEFWIRNIVSAPSAGSVINGKGDIVLPINTGENVEEKLLPITLNNWKLDTDGMTVAKGTQVHESFGGDTTKMASGMKLNPIKIDCTAQTTPMQLTMDVSPQDTTLRLEGSDDPIKWKNISAPLSGKGDWTYTDTKKKEFAIGWSGFKISSSSTTIDLSNAAGSGLSSDCGGGGAEWTGLHLGNATLVPNTFGLVQNGYSKIVTNWGILSDGICGSADFGNFNVGLKEGTVAFDSLHAEAKGGKFTADYNNMDVYVPWLDTHLKGNASLQDGEPGKESTVSFKGLHAPAVTKTYGPVSFKADNLVFGSYEGVGWGVWSDTTFTFKGKNTIVTDKALQNGLIFGMDGRAHLLNEETSSTIPLGGKGNFGGTPVDLVSADLTLNPKSGATLIDFRLNTAFTISEVMPKVDVPVGYALKKQSGSYGSQGPDVKPFEVSVAFPQGQPNVQSKITVNLLEDASQTAAKTVDMNRFLAGHDDQGNPYYSDVPLYAAPEEGALYASNIPIYLASADPTEGDQFTGAVDMGMFDGPPVKAEFRLGYKGGHDYWLMRATVDTGGITFVPPILSLYKIRGGLGHNFSLDAFQHPGSINNVYPQMDNSYMFMAGMRIGSPDRFIVMLDGDLTIKLGEGAKLDFRSWLLKATQDGQGDLHGYIKYAGGGFDGMMMGKFSFLDGVVYAEIPENAMTMHAGNGDWYIYAGKKEGPRIRAHVMIMDADSYIMFDSNGLLVGGGLHYYLNAGIGHISGDVDMGCAMTSQPHISGYAEGNFKAEVCCCSCCVGPTITVGVNAGALPVSASAHGCVKIDLGIKTVKKCANFSL